MAEPQDSCVGYWKLEDRLASIGTDFTEAGTPNYTNAVKFNNGFYNNNIANYLYCSDVFFNKNLFIYEDWFETDYDVINGIPQDGSNHALFGWAGPSASHFIYGQFNTAQGLVLFVRVVVSVIYQCTNVAVTFSAGTMHHVVIVYSTAGIAGGPDICRMYFDGSLVFNSIVTQLVQPNPGTFLQNVWGYSATRVEPFDGTSDNVKIYNSATQVVIDAILANRDNEEWPSVSRTRTRIN